MSTVRKLNESALRGIYDAYMHEAFPPAELKPLAVMLRLMERGRYLCYGYYRNGRLAAYAFFYRHDSRVLLLDYFAVTPELRGRGVGSAFLAALDAVLGGVCILGEVEMPDSHDAGLNAMRLRRIAFYERAGFSLTGAACRRNSQRQKYRKRERKCLFRSTSIQSKRPSPPPPGRRG